MILAIDPGTNESAFVLLKPDKTLLDFGIERNIEVVGRCELARLDQYPVVIEMISNYGKITGSDTHMTLTWIGRFTQATHPGETVWLYRPDIKLHLCNDRAAKDSNVRQALIDRYGGQIKAIGNRKARGPLHGVHKDVWSALAVGYTYMSMQGRWVMS